VWRVGTLAAAEILVTRNLFLDNVANTTSTVVVFVCAQPPRCWEKIVCLPLNQVFVYQCIGMAI
jgi:hypothetical protein